MKKILILLFAAAVIFSIAFFSISAISPSAKAPATTQMQYQIGDKVLDAGGSLWEYKGKTAVTVGQITKDCKLLTVFCCNREKRVLGVHPETIPYAQINDLFTLINPSKAFRAFILNEDGIEFGSGYEICNITTADPPSALPSLDEGALCCTRLSCSD